MADEGEWTVMEFDDHCHHGCGPKLYSGMGHVDADDCLCEQCWAERLDIVKPKPTALCTRDTPSVNFERAMADSTTAPSTTAPAAAAPTGALATDAAAILALVATVNFPASTKLNSALGVVRAVALEVNQLCLTLDASKLSHDNLLLMANALTSKMATDGVISATMAADAKTILDAASDTVQYINDIAASAGYGAQANAAETKVEAAADTVVSAAVAADAQLTKLGCCTIA
jgi:hypothetical protein